MKNIIWLVKKLNRPKKEIVLIGAIPIVGLTLAIILIIAKLLFNYLPIPP